MWTSWAGETVIHSGNEKSEIVNKSATKVFDAHIEIV